MGGVEHQLQAVAAGDGFEGLLELGVLLCKQGDLALGLLRALVRLLGVPVETVEAGLQLGVFDLDPVRAFLFTLLRFRLGFGGGGWLGVRRSCLRRSRLLRSGDLVIRHLDPVSDALAHAATAFSSPSMIPMMSSSCMT